MTATNPNKGPHKTFKEDERCFYPPMETDALTPRKLPASSKLPALAFWACVMVLVAIVIHLAAESVGIGLRELSAEMLTRHIYLTISGISALGLATALSGFFAAPATRLHRLTNIVSGLPFGGTGTCFLALCFGIQIFLFAGTQLIEGCPIATGNVVAASLSALLLCAGASVGCGELPQRVLRILAVLYLSRSLERNRYNTTPSRFLHGLFIPLFQTYQGVVGSRPPPGLSVFAPSFLAG
jgi:hypothetical protein